MRRGRRSKGLRNLASETLLRKEGLILPLFVVPGEGREEPVASMPGVSRRSLDILGRMAGELEVNAVLILGVPDPEEKNGGGSAALKENGIVPLAVKRLKRERPELTVITDVCLCPYTSHGHCGILSGSGEVDNDRTLEILARIAVIHAVAGADMVAPSAMMDGQVRAVREELDGTGFQDTAILSYAAKFSSAFYGPFREAAGSAPAFGDRNGYQISPANRREALRDALMDEEEGADWLMVKPALPYLDVLAALRRVSRLPIAAYQVSGEYAMLKFASGASAISEKEAVLEAMMCIHRAGADAVITYYADDICRWIENRATPLRD